MHIPNLDNKKWTNYFLNEFIPKYNYYEDLKNSLYNYVFYTNKNQYPGIIELSNELQQKYNFPTISYFIIINHKETIQPVHKDGEANVRYASLNLLISGYENTKMIFYKENNPSLKKNVTNAHYYDIDDLTYIDELQGTNDWVMINSGAPHQAVSIDLTNTRLAVCIRFDGNPTFEDLIKNVKS